MMPPLTRYDPVKGKIFLAKDSTFRDLSVITQEIQAHLKPYLPETLIIDSYHSKKRNVEPTIKFVLQGHASLPSAIRQNIRSKKFSFTTKERYLPIKKILKEAQAINEIIQVEEEKRAFAVSLTDSIRKLRKTLNIRPKDYISWRNDQETPFELRLSLSTEEEVRSVYRLIREVCMV